jgi:signal transduction histidine kinase
MVLILTVNQTSPTSFPTQSTQVDSTLLFVADKGSNEYELVSQICDDQQKEIEVVCSIHGALDSLKTGNTGVLLIGSEFIPYLTLELINEIKRNSPDVTVLLLVKDDESLDNLLSFYDTGIVDTISLHTDVRLVRKKISMYETIFNHRKELRLLNDRLTKANQQLEEYVYIVSHDLKAPLRGLSSLAEFIHEELGDTTAPVVREMLGLMQSRTERMQQMIDGILHYSRMSSNCGEKEPVDCKVLINNIIDLLSPEKEMRFEFPDVLPVIECEKIKLQEVFQNLVLNSIKHNDNQQVNIKLTCQDIGNSYLFSITDNGKGIKSEHQEKIFGFFQTLIPKDKSEGTGLGLTIVKKIVEQQGGEVRVKSELGKGSTFSFTWTK